MKNLMAVLTAILAVTGCTQRQADGTELTFIPPQQPLAQGLFGTYLINFSTDDCGKLDIPGLNCTVKQWDFDGTTLEVDAPEGMEVVGTGRESEDYWFAVRCTKALPSGTTTVTARFMANGRIRYEGTVGVQCRRAASASLFVTDIYARDPDQNRVGEHLRWTGPESLHVVSDVKIWMEFTLTDADGNALFGYGREVLPADGPLRHESLELETPPSSYSYGGKTYLVKGIPGLRLVTQGVGTGSRLRVDGLEIALPIEPLPDDAWDLTLSWASTDKNTRVYAHAVTNSGDGVYGLGHCTVTLTTATGEQLVKTGGCAVENEDVYDIPNVTKVCVSERGKTVCK